MEYISYCGLICNECPIYIATRDKDDLRKEQLAKEYSFEKNEFTKGDINCYGCFSESANESKICGHCTIRNCVVDKELKNCGYCKNYPCNQIDKYLPKESDHRKRLDKINYLLG